MSEEMAVTDNASSEDAKLNDEEASIENAVESEVTPPEAPTHLENPPAIEQSENVPTEDDLISKLEMSDEETIETKVEESPDKLHSEPQPDVVDRPHLEEAKLELIENTIDDEEKRGVKRRASTAFSDNGDEEFKGFDVANPGNLMGYSRALERLEAEVTAASKDFTPVRNIMATPSAPVRASKRPRQDTDGSRPSSALSSRSDETMPGDVGASPGAGRGRRGAGAGEMSSPLLRVPLERGWKRELVYRAALDAHSRRNADIYYYTPKGKKLRSTREVAEHLSGTGLTLENFSFFKEPLGVDDPEKEIIRDAKLIRRMESPVSSPAIVPVASDAKRTPKPKAPKGASPEPATPKSPPAKIKVKSVGSRLSNSSPAPPKQGKKGPPTPAAAPAGAPAADNNNSAAWKKPRPPATATATVATTTTAAATATAPTTLATTATPSPATASLPPPPLQSRPPQITSPENCRKSTSPCSEPPPLTHKSGVTTSSIAASLPAPVPRRVPVPIPVPVPVPVPKVVRPEKRVLLRMKAASGGVEGERVWAVAGAGAGPGVGAGAAQKAASNAGAGAGRPAGSLPQVIVRLNGRRFIVVGRSMLQPSQQSGSVPQGRHGPLLLFCPVTRTSVRRLSHSEEKRRGAGRIANGAASPPAGVSPRRRGRPRHDDTDYFTAFYTKAQENSYNVVVQIFQYLGMRDLAHCARVCKLWKQMASTPALWRHVRMKNSHVSDWGGLCSALKSHGTKWLDLRKMLLPQNDTVFWEQFAQHIPTVDTLERIELCRCPARAVEAVCAGLPNLVALSALAIRDAALDPGGLAHLSGLRELRLKSMAGLSLARDLTPIAQLTRLTHLSLTSIKELGWHACDVIGQLSNLESLELGECTFRAEFAGVLAKLGKLRRLRLERGTAQCAAPALLRALAQLPLLTRLELVNVDVKVGFDDALAECKNIQRLLIIPTYVSQSATTNKQVLSGVLRLKDTLTHLMWGVTIELLRVTELFIDQCEQSGDKRRDIGECIPVLKPVPGCRLPDHKHVHGPPQVEILPLPTLQRLLSAQLPHTKLKLLRIPFHATWRQSLADFQ